MNTPLWIPKSDSARLSQIADFARRVSAQIGEDVSEYEALHHWSVQHPEQFWEAVWEYCGIMATDRGETTVINRDQLPGARWFPDAKLNFAENLLRSRDDQPAIVFRNELGETTSVTHQMLFDSVSALCAALRDAGLKPGDRVAGFMPNIPETVIAMLATTAAGGVWSSCSPDFGVSGVLDRFGQIEPKFLFCTDAYYYNGKPHDCIEKVVHIAASMPTLQRVIVVPFVSNDPDIGSMHTGVLISDFTTGHEATVLEFEQLPFNHPLYIMFSSGTTGVPKCIVHGVGGTLLQHLKEHKLHCNVTPGTKLFYFTTCGWMMWNWSATGLASEATLMLYDGSPFYPDGNVLFDFAAEQGIEIFGTSAKYLDACAKEGIRPVETHRLDSVKAILSTGSPLSPEGFDYVYQSVKADVCLSSIAGGTDIISCFVCGNPALPVWRGEIQVAALGMDVRALDDDGQPLPDGEKGELCCLNSFVSMPVGFWADEDGSRYRSAYFEKFPGIWCHGDYVARTDHGGWIIFGRSDAVLNPGGVRIGTAEIYRQAEKVDEVLESLVIGQRWNNDVRVVLFVRLKEGLTLDDDLKTTIRTTIRKNATPRHVPAKIIQVADIPRTKSGKIVELAVRKMVHGEIVKNREALANPEALDLFKELPDLAAD